MSSNHTNPSQNGNAHRRPYNRRQRTTNHNPAPTLCSVCSTQPPKYKCPKCRASYCSVDCCRKHKAELCTALTTTTTTTTNDKESSSGDAGTLLQSQYVDNLTKDQLQPPLKRPKRQRQFQENDEDDGWHITNPMKQRLHNSHMLKQTLQDPGLRFLIGQIYAASNLVPRHRHGKQSDNNSHTQTDQEVKLDELRQSNPAFKRFIEQLLVETGVVDSNGSL